jgi:hypothetical protein
MNTFFINFTSHLFLLNFTPTQIQKSYSMPVVRLSPAMSQMGGEENEGMNPSRLSIYTTPSPL